MPHKFSCNLGFDENDGEKSEKMKALLLEAKKNVRRFKREERRFEYLHKPSSLVLAARGLSEPEEELLDLFMERHEDAVVLDRVEPERTTLFILGFEAHDLIDTQPVLLCLAARLPIVSSLWLLESLETIASLEDSLVDIKGARLKDFLYTNVTFSFDPEVPDKLRGPLKEIIQAANGKLVDSVNALAKARTKLKVLLLPEDGRKFTKRGVHHIPVTWIRDSLLQGTCSLK